jgi:hypothetical protein
VQRIIGIGIEIPEGIVKIEEEMGVFHFFGFSIFDFGLVRRRDWSNYILNRINNFNH